MSANSHPRDWLSDLEELAARELDTLCDRFEAAWKRGSARPIEDCIASIADDHRRPFTLELITLEIQLRRKAHQSPTPDDYRSRFPLLANDIDELFLEPTVIAKALPEPSSDRRDRASALPQPRQVIGDFEIIEKLETGGMGVVYKAWQISVKRQVALKVIRSGDSAASKEVARFLNEAEAAAKLEHSGIVPIFGSGSQDGQNYLAMAFIDGPSLAKRIKEGPIPAREAAELIRRVALAVDYAHRQGVIHRDLKPGNILLAPLDQPTNRSQGIWDESPSPRKLTEHQHDAPASGQVASDRIARDSEALREREGEAPAEPRTAEKHGSAGASPSRKPASSDAAQLTYEPKITDFGLAKLLGADRELTQTGEILGTPEYMPPEQASGQMKSVKEAADIYSLGAILYRLLTGRPPIYDENPLKLLKLLADADPIEPRLLVPGLPRDLETICLKCLEKDPSRRFPTAAALAQELHRFLHGEPIHSRPITQWERARKWCQRNPTVASLSAAVVLVLLTARHQIRGPMLARSQSSMSSIDH